MSVSDLLNRSSLAGPRVTFEQAAALLQRSFGLQVAVAQIEALGSQQDINFKVVAANGHYVLKLCHAQYGAAQLHAQQAALSHLQARQVPVPQVVPALDGAALLEVVIDGQRLFARLLTYIEGQPLTRRPHLGRETFAELGRTCARVDLALADFDHPGLQRTLQWDPRHAQALIAGLASALRGSARQAEVLAVGERACERIAQLAAALPLQAIHLDITDDNTVWQRDARRHWQLQGIIDFGDLVRSWRIADLAVTCAALLHHAEGEPFAILPTVQAYHASNPLTGAELRALWPLIVARAAVLVLSSAQQLQVAPDNGYVLDNVEHEWQIFEVAISVPGELMEAAILLATGQELPALAHPPLVPLLPSLQGRPVTPVALGVLSPLWHNGNWQQPGIDQHLLAAAAASGNGLATSLYGEYRLSRSVPDSAQAPASCALHVELKLPHGTLLQAPFAGTLRRNEGLLRLQGAGLQLIVRGADCELADGVGVAAGEPLGHSTPALQVQLTRLAEVVPPLFVTALRAPAWLALCEAPGELLGFVCQAPALPDAGQLLARRDASFARSQKHYYQDPPQIERGWRNQLIDLQGRSYLDMLNNVAVLGHGHPRMAEVAARQWSLLNTNSRFHYSAIAEFSERLLAPAPAGMDRVFLVNSGTEANDLAIRLAWAWRGGRDVLSVLEAYHGWSVATDAISTSIADNPQALETRPDWVHPLLAPNSYRGVHRGAQSVAPYIEEVDALLARLAQQQRQVAGFICEPVYGNAGGIALPAGYLREVYARVRAAGGLCIADEVQVGYGRLGEYFWGFEEQGVVPDIITMAKGMGNGHPLGAVITRREVAEALEAEGYFFSSAGASPVSCQIGMAVLDVMDEEQLWQRAREVGGYFKARLEALVEHYPLVGAVHGSGFYLGLELVRDRSSLEPATEETALLCDRLRELGIFMQPTGDYLNILKIKPPMVTTRESVDFFVDAVARVLGEDL
ncbi:aminotransferase [Pseudomonas sp. HR96]|uniref:aminotransferase n=1 Tax=Pseudomonas sp. HR96 TaxID=1027966 RepID=UPI002A757B4B|nr:aminotransferase [Pseudomonas sp. HR96]WPO99716.1 aminotransferase [Pseudomonas sp. HR96]